MIEILEMHPSNVLGMKVSGKIEKEDIEAIIPAMKEKVAACDKVNLYVEIESLTGMSLDAVIEKFRYALFSIKHIKKEAVVADASWMTTLLDVAGKLYHVYPGIEVKHFPKEKRDEALEWIAS
jgi:hypothetical protein